MAKVVALDHSGELGGAEIGLANLAAEAMGGIHILLLADGPYAEYLKMRGIEPTICQANSASRVHRGSSIASTARTLVEQAQQLRPHILRTMRQHGANVLVCNTLRATMLAALCRLPREIKTIVMIRDGLVPPYLNRFEATAAQIAATAAGDIVVANSEWTAARVRTFRRKLVLPPMIAREFFEHPVPRPADRPPRVLMLGRIAHWKGQLFGLQAAAQVGARAEWELAIAGGPWFGEERYFQEVSRAAKAMRAPSPHLYGHVDDVRSLIDDYDVVVHTSTIPEPFGQVIVQAMARGKLVIASGEGGPAEILSHEKTGLLFEPRSVTSLVRVLRHAIQSPDLRRELGEAAPSAVMRFHPDRTYKRLLAIVDDLPRRRARAAS